MHNQHIIPLAKKYLVTLLGEFTRIRYKVMLVIYVSYARRRALSALSALTCHHVQFTPGAAGELALPAPRYIIQADDLNDLAAFHCIVNKSKTSKAI